MPVGDPSERAGGWLLAHGPRGMCMALGGLIAVACAAPRGLTPAGERLPRADAPRPRPASAPRRLATESRERENPTRTLRAQAAIQALPVIARIDGLAPTSFVLRGHLSAERAAVAVRVARAVVADIGRRFVGIRANDLPPVDICLFEDDAGYLAFSRAVRGRRTMMGYYLARERVVAANLGRGLGNLSHELVHPLVGDSFPAAPVWFNEGLGSLYGGSRVLGGRVRFHVNYRLRAVRRALRRGSLPSTAALARSSASDVYGARRMVYYGVARYALLYLEALGQLEPFYRELSERAGDPAAEGELLARYIDAERFQHWLRRLRVGRIAPRPRDR